MSADNRLAPTECCGDGPDDYCVDCPENPNPHLTALKARVAEVIQAHHRADQHHCGSPDCVGDARYSCWTYSLARSISDTLPTLTVPQPRTTPDLLATLEARYDALQDRIAHKERKRKYFKALLLTHRADELAEAIAIVRGVK